MQSMRKRKQPKLRNKSIDIDEDEDNYKKALPAISRRLLNGLVAYKKKIVIFVMVVSLLVYIYWPAPKLSRHAQHWRDSSYLYTYEGNKILYQDILSLKRPVRMHPVLLILHGFPTSSYDWKNLIPSLQQKFRRIIIPDMLGLGFSDKPKGHNYSVKEQATIVEKILSSSNVKDVHILAHDYGDTVAQELVARAGEPGRFFDLNIKSLCLTNGGILPDSHKPLFIQKLLLVPVLNKIISSLSNFYIFSSRFSSVFGADTQPSSEVLYDFWSIIRHNEGDLALSSVLQYLPERQENKKRWVSALQHTPIPLHLIYGPQDPINPEQFLSEYKKLVPNSSVSVLKNTGHYPHLENETGFIKFYYEFLVKVEREFYKL